MRAGCAVKVSAHHLKPLLGGCEDAPIVPSVNSPLQCILRAGLVMVTFIWLLSYGYCNMVTVLWVL